MNRSAWSGWVGFAGWLMVIIGSVEVFEGLIAIVRGQYYVMTSQSIVVFNVKTWGWIALIWGIIMALVGLGLLSAASWARWVAIVIGSLSFILQLGFLGSTPYPLWALTVMGLTLVVLYALVVRWGEATATQ